MGHFRQRGRCAELVLVSRRNEAPELFPGKSPLGPFFDPPFGGYRREGGSVRYFGGEGESRGRVAAVAPFIAPAREARGR
jgi:hypothetical protein